MEDSSADKFSLKSRIITSSIVMVVLIGGFGGWAASAQLAAAVVAQGSVVVAKNVKKIQHREGGIVSKINVENGDAVEAGAVLVMLDDTQVRAALGVLKSQMEELAGRRARLLTERDTLGAIKFPAQLSASAEGLSIIAGEQRVFEDNQSTRISQKEQLTARIGQFGEEIKGLTAQLSSKQRELEALKKRQRRIKRLRLSKLVSIARLEVVESERERVKGALGGLIAQIARAGGQINEVKLQILSIDQRARTEAQKELRIVEAKLAELEERRLAAQDRLQRMVLRAPIDGSVHQLNIHTIGGVVSAAEPLMLIVPQNDSLSVEVRFAATDIDQLTIGQTARIRFSAFNQSTTPEVPGVVTHIAPDVVRDAKSGQNYYLGRLDLTADGVKKIGNRRLLPGMPAEIYITTSERSALSYFVKPFTEKFNKMFNEE